MNRLLTGVIVLLFPLFALAADISGKWKAEFATPDGTQRVNTFTFKVDGGKLTGTFGTFTYSGKVSGGEIKFKVTFNDQSFEITAKRAP
jgi:hypothetical protein